MEAIALAIDRERRKSRSWTEGKGARHCDDEPLRDIAMFGLFFWLPAIPARPAARGARRAATPSFSRRAFVRSGREVLAVPWRRRPAQGRPAIDSRPDVLKGGDSGAVVVAGRTREQPADRGHSLRARAQDAAQRQAGGSRDRGPHALGCARAALARDHARARDRRDREAQRSA